MMKSRKKLAITAILAGSVIAAVSACQQNVTVYGPPEDFTNENSNNEASKPSEEKPSEESSSEDYDPEENMIEDVYGPPMDYEAD